MTVTLILLAFFAGLHLTGRAARLVERVIEADARFALMEAKIIEARNAALVERVRHENEVRVLREAFRQLAARNPFHTPPEKDRVVLESLARIRMSERANFN